MLRIIVNLVLLLSTLLSVKCEGELLILQSPKAVQFRNGNELPVSQLRDVVSAAFGFTVEEKNTWPAMRIESPFGFAVAVLLIFLPGITSLGSSKGVSYPLIMDDDVHRVWSDVVREIEIRYPENKVKFEKIDLVKPVIINEISEEYMQNGQTTFNQTRMASEGGLSTILSEFKAAGDQILTTKNKDGVPDVYVIEFPNMALISKLPSQNAKELLLDEMISMSDKAQNLYNGKILVAVISEGEESAGVRLKRQTTKETPVTMAELNVADDYDENFPVIFNIILWLSVALIFSLIAISMVIAGMDPGRDSIIYRMTSTRMKKDT